MLTNNELASAIAGELDIKTEMGREIIPIALECVKLFDQKQQDYGSKNISISGKLGLAVRLTDKVCRMHNLLKKDEGDINHESLEDSFKDTANYGMIGMMLSRDIWK